MWGGRIFERLLKICSHPSLRSHAHPSRHHPWAYFQEIIIYRYIVWHGTCLSKLRFMNRNLTCLFRTKNVWNTINNFWLGPLPLSIKTSFMWKNLTGLPLPFLYSVSHHGGVILNTVSSVCLLLGYYTTLGLKQPVHNEYILLTVADLIINTAYR